MLWTDETSQGLTYIKEFPGAAKVEARLENPEMASRTPTISPGRSRAAAKRAAVIPY